MRNKNILTGLLSLGAIGLTKLALLPENTILHLVCNVALVIALLSFGDELVYTLFFLPIKAIKKLVNLNRSRGN